MEITNGQLQQRDIFDYRGNRELRAYSPEAFLCSDIWEVRIFSRDEKKQDDMYHELQAGHPDAAKSQVL